MTEKKNNIKRNFLILGAIVFLITILAFFQTQINSMIASHPKIAEIERVQGLTEYKYDTLIKMIQALDHKVTVLDRKVTKLSCEEYP